MRYKKTSHEGVTTHVNEEDKTAHDQKSEQGKVEGADRLKALLQNGERRRTIKEQGGKNLKWRNREE